MKTKSTTAEANETFGELKELMLGAEQRELGALREGLEDKQRFLAALSDDLEAKRRALSDLRHTLEDQAGQLREIRGGLEEKGGQISGLRQSQILNEAQVSGLRDSQENSEVQISGLRESQEHTEAQVSGLRDSQEHSEVQISGLRDSQEHTEAQISGLRKSQEHTEAQVSGLRDSQENSEVQVSGLRDSQDRTELQVSALRTSQEQNESRISRLREGLEQTESRISDLREGMEGGQRERADLREGLEDKERALAELREILEGKRHASDELRKDLEKEQNRLNAFGERLDERENNSVGRLAGDLAAALRRRKELGEESFDDLAAAMQSGTEAAIQKSVSTDKQPLTKALFPIMGPAIRNYVVDLFRGMAEELNKSIEDATSVERIKWRFEAKMAGKPYAEYVLLKTRSFRIEEVYLMQRETGLLLLHAAVDPADEADGEADLVSGMFTAIRSFVKDSFAQGDRSAGGSDAVNGDEEELDSFTFGEREVLIEVGPSLVLAAVAYGAPAPADRDELKGVLENLHAELQGRLDRFSGNTAELEDARPTLRKALIEKAIDSEEEPGKGGAGKTWIALGVVALGVAAWIFFSVREQVRWDRFEEALRAQSGITVTEVVDTGWWRHREVRGVRDPLAADPAAVAGESGIDLEKTAFAFALVESLEPGFSARRAAVAEKEKKALLDQLETLRRAQAKSQEEASARAARLEAEALSRAARSTESLVRSFFGDVPGLSVQFAGDQILFHGELAASDYQRVLSRLEPLKGLRTVDTSGLSNGTGQRIASLLRRIAAFAILFREGSPDGEDEERLDQLAGLLGELNEVASETEASYTFTILAHPLIGTSRAANRLVEEKRVEQVRRKLIDRGFAPKILETRLSDDLTLAGQGVTVVPVESSTER